MMLGANNPKFQEVKVETHENKLFTGNFKTVSSDCRLTLETLSCDQADMTTNQPRQKPRDPAQRKTAHQHQW